MGSPGRRRRPRGPRPDGRIGGRGSALVVVIWVIGLLSLFVGTFAFDARLEAQITSYCRKRTKAEYLARSGITIAEMLMTKREMVKNVSEPEQEDRWFEAAKRLSGGLPIKGDRAVQEDLGDGTVTVEVEPEPARRNVNRLMNEEDWEGVLDVANIPEDMWPDLVDAFLDWVDKDDEPRSLRGAESDYYETEMDPPYRAQNGPLDDVQELLWVKGFSRPILSGGVLETEEGGARDRQRSTAARKPRTQDRDREGDEEDEDNIVRLSGIQDLLTTYGDGKVNVNAAEKRVLMTLPGVDEIIADRIMEEREGLQEETGHMGLAAAQPKRKGGVGEQEEDTSFKSVNDVFARVPDLNPALRNYISTDSAIYRITSTGTVGGVRRTVWCIARYSNRKLTILRWREED